MQKLQFRSLYLNGSLSWVIKSYSSDLLWPSDLSFDFRQALISDKLMFPLVSLVLSFSGMLAGEQWEDQMLWLQELCNYSRDRCSAVIWIFKIIFPEKKEEKLGG